MVFVLACFGAAPCISRKYGCHFPIQPDRKVSYYLPRNRARSSTDGL